MPGIKLQLLPDSFLNSLYPAIEKWYNRSHLDTQRAFTRGLVSYCGRLKWWKTLSLP